MESQFPGNSNRTSPISDVNSEAQTNDCGVSHIPTHRNSTGALPRRRAPSAIESILAKIEESTGAMTTETELPLPIDEAFLVRRGSGATLTPAMVRRASAAGFTDTMIRRASVDAQIKPASQRTAESSDSVTASSSLGPPVSSDNFKGVKAIQLEKISAATENEPELVPDSGTRKNLRPVSMKELPNPMARETLTVRTVPLSDEDYWRDSEFPGESESGNSRPSSLRFSRTPPGAVNSVHQNQSRLSLLRISLSIKSSQTQSTDGGIWTSDHKSVNPMYSSSPGPSSGPDPAYLSLGLGPAESTLSSLQEKRPQKSSLNRGQTISQSQSSAQLPMYKSDANRNPTPTVASTSGKVDINLYSSRDHDSLVESLFDREQQLRRHPLSSAKDRPMSIGKDQLDRERPASTSRGKSGRKEVTREINDTSADDTNSNHLSTNTTDEVSSSLNIETKVKKHREGESKDKKKKKKKRRRPKFDPQQKEIADTLAKRGELSHEICKYKDALISYGGALKIYYSIYGDTHKDIAKLLFNIANVYISLRHPDLALENFEESLRITLALYGPVHERVAIAYDGISVLYFNLQMYEHAIKAREEATKIHCIISGKPLPRKKKSTGGCCVVS